MLERARKVEEETRRRAGGRQGGLAGAGGGRPQGDRNGDLVAVAIAVISGAAAALGAWTAAAT